MANKLTWFSSQEKLNELTSNNNEVFNSHSYKDRIQKTIWDSMDSFRKTRIKEHHRQLTMNNPETIKKIKTLLKNIKIKKDSDKRIITLNLKNKYTIIEPRLDKISDPIYNKDIDLYRIEPAFTHYVSARWVRWNINQRLNKSLQEYTKKIKNLWFNIPTKDETNNILKEIWEISGLDNEILMDIFIYLTGLRWNYLLKSLDKNKIGEKTMNLWPFSWYESVDWDYPIKLIFLKKE